MADPYPPSPCPFCAIAHTYPPIPHQPVPPCPDPTLLDPQCHLVLSTPHLLAFLDILPMTPAHILLTTRTHCEKLSDLHAPSAPALHPTTDPRAAHLRETARELGRYLPLLSRALCRATGVEDWNVVQNNGARAAQVVPHVHFHLIPRYQEGREEAERAGKRGEGEMLRSWRMFGKGVREELDDEEAVGVAEGLRRAVEEVLEEEKARRGMGKL